MTIKVCKRNYMFKIYKSLWKRKDKKYLFCIKHQNNNDNKCFVDEHAICLIENFYDCRKYHIYK